MLVKTQEGGRKFQASSCEPCPREVSASENQATLNTSRSLRPCQLLLLRTHPESSAVGGRVEEIQSPPFFSSSVLFTLIPLVFVDLTHVCGVSTTRLALAQTSGSPRHPCEVSPATPPSHGVWPRVTCREIPQLLRELRWKCSLQGHFRAPSVCSAPHQGETLNSQVRTFLLPSSPTASLSQEEHKQIHRHPQWHTGGSGTQNELSRGKASSLAFSPNPFPSK